MQTAKILLPILALIASASSYAAAQELKTASQCRAYRDAWFTSTDRDKQQLPVRELVSRAQKMIICTRDIDKAFLKQGTTYEEGMNVEMGAMAYEALIGAYYQEAFSRASLFLNDKNLTTTFISDDAKRH